MRLVPAAAALVSVATGSVAVPGAAAEVTDRISVRGTGGNHVDAFSPALRVIAVSPAEYRRGSASGAYAPAARGAGTYRVVAGARRSAPRPRLLARQGCGRSGDRPHRAAQRAAPTA